MKSSGLILEDVSADVTLKANSHKIQSINICKLSKELVMNARITLFSHRK